MLAKALEFFNNLEGEKKNDIIEKLIHIEKYPDIRISDIILDFEE